MNALRTIVTEFVGLFIEDRLFALAIALWIAFAAAMAYYAIGTPELRGLVLFLGLAAVLACGIVRGARPR
ncbi:MAG: hypothetical protein NVSMB21_17380 [Vulcanimicrobiaceae bacterium]